MLAAAVAMWPASPARGDDAKLARDAYAQSYLENDFSYLDDDDYNGSYLGESLKRLRPLDCLTIDVGGQYRTRFHNENNLRGRRLSGRSDNFYLHRTRLFTDLHWGQDLRLFAEMIDATSEENDFTSRPTELNRMDVQNLVVDVRLLTLGSTDQWWLRAGRQELYLGSQRLVSSRPWRNTPLNHDGVRSWWSSKNHRLDAFWVHPLSPAQHIPEDHNFDRPDRSRQFFGAFVQTKQDDRLSEVYYYGLVEDDPRVPDFAGNLGDFDIHTIGGRVKVNHNDNHFELEGGYQFGTFSTLRHSAGFFTAGIGRDLTRIPMKPTLWLFFDWASGDSDLDDGTHGTFQQLSPRGHFYLGWADLTGRQNIQDLNLQMSIPVTESVEFRSYFHSFWLESRKDAVYSLGGAPLYQDPTGSASNQLATELDLQVRWSITPRTHFLCGYTYLWAGDYFDSPVIQNGPAGIANNGVNGGDGEFTYAQFTLRF